MNPLVAAVAGSEGPAAPPIKPSRPSRLQRSRRRGAGTPHGAIYVGRPTLWSNPFAGRAKIGHARSVIFYRSWLAGELSPHILTRAGFSDAEIVALARWRSRLVSDLATLRGRDLQCWCPLTSAWCHADVLLRAANRDTA